MYDIWSMYQVYYHATQSNMQQNGELKIKKTKDKESAGKFWYYIKTNPVIVGHHLFIGLFGFSVIVVRAFVYQSNRADLINLIFLVS